MRNQQSQKGFTLMELMIVIVIIGILAAIAFPSYQNSVRKSQRTEAKTALLQAMARQEQYFSENRSYTQDPSLVGQSSTGASSASAYLTENEHYEITLGVTAQGMSLIRAQAIGAQADDSIQRFTINSLGRKAHSKSVTGNFQVGWDD